MVQEHTHYGIGDMNMVVVSHDHVDHCQDFGTLVSLLRQYNKRGLKDGSIRRPHTLDLLMSHGVAAQFASVINHSENTPFLRMGKCLPGSTRSPIERVQAPPGAAGIGDDLATGRWDPAQSAVCTWYNSRIEDQYRYRLHLLPAKHVELLGEQTAMGFRFELLQPHQQDACCEIVISGDTGVVGEEEKIGIKAKDLAQHYAAGCSKNTLLVLHAGTMEECVNGSDLKREEEHLGLMGVVEVLEQLVLHCGQNGKPLPKAVALTEWGYEFGRLGSNGRTEFTKLAVEEVRTRVGDRFFAAVSGAEAKDRQIPIIPSDIELRFNLPNLDVWCRTGPKTAAWRPAASVRAEEQCPGIIYRAAA
jgi:hypothetical protein